MIGSWRVALRIAWREALRARGRTALVFCMVALPVAAVIAIDTLARTSEVSPQEGLDQELGSAAAVVRDGGERVALEQDPVSAYPQPHVGATRLPPTRAADVLSRLPSGARLAEVREGQVELRTPRGALLATAFGADFSDPLVEGVYRIAGRRPVAPGEIAVSARIAERGFAPGTRAELGASRSVRVVGTLRGPVGLGELAVAGRPETLGLTGRPESWLVGSREPVGWDAVRRLNELGLTVVSRAVVKHPPAAAQVTSTDAAGAAVLALVVAMALLQVALLAGPAFAVGARRQRRALALFAATGGTPRDVRRVVLAGGVVIGGAAALAGAVGGVLAAYALRGLADPGGGVDPGPFEVPARDVVLVAAFGLISAVVAALAPAVSASRSDVVAVLAGRRGETRGSGRSLTAGVVLLAVGVLGAVLGANGGGELSVAFAAVPTMLGAILLAPALLERAGRLAHVLPLPARLAVRDAARQRTRTAPAVAAVAATVAGVVALGIGAASDASEREATYTPQAPRGTGVLVAPEDGASVMSRVRATLTRELPGARRTPLRGVPEPGYGSTATGEFVESLEICEPGTGARSCASTSSYSSFGSQYLIGPAALAFLDLPPSTLARARRTLAAGGLVAFGDAPSPSGRATVTRTRSVLDTSPDATSERVVARVTVPALTVKAPAGGSRAAAVLSDEAVRRLRLRSALVSTVVDGVPIGRAAEERINESLDVLGDSTFLRVERGPDDSDLRVVLALLGAVGAVLVLGGTLTATLLALSEARPDFGTLLAVGATPGVRRATAACYAGVIGLLGALLGALAGLVPGIAVAFPLTGRRSGRPEGDGLPDVFISIPWPLLAALVVGVPLLAAGGVALFTRAGPPLTYRRT